ncbi:MAG: methylated-DNA--[protein]-cysteine S-methyltransferase [Gammaproteobacteria bacterium]|nr:methylated-DNA--[protein]-cysteine S-methyltransferase [Gammaproteobacteria bacterium]
MLANRSYDAVISTPFQNFKLALHTADNKLSRIEFVTLQHAEISARNCTAEAVVQQLMAYFNDPTFPFSLPLKSDGTPFQQQVWAAMCGIKAGQTATYGDLAKRLGSAPRAVGGACRVNPVPIVVPCHRVVSAAGIGGFLGASAGDGINIKRCLLEHERRQH